MEQMSLVMRDATVVPLHGRSSVMTTTHPSETMATAVVVIEAPLQMVGWILGKSHYREDTLLSS